MSERHVLETDFPLQSAPPKMSNMYNQSLDPSSNQTLTSDWTQQQFQNSLSRLSASSTTSNKPTLYNTHRQYPHHHHHHHQIATNSKQTTNLDFAQVCETDDDTSFRLPSSKTTRLRRSGSLRKAVNNDGSDPDDYDENEQDEAVEVLAHHDQIDSSAEAEPLFNPAQRSRSGIHNVKTNSNSYSFRSDQLQTSPLNTYLGDKEQNQRLLTAEQRSRHRKHDDDSMSPMSRCWLGFLILLAQILLNGVMALCLFWVIKYHSQDYVPFAWKSNPKLEFNLHPVLMIAGFIYFMGQAMILYRTCRCCRRIWNKLLHTILHILAIPCIVIGFIAVLDSHNLRKDKDGNPAPIPNFYSLHSWIGLTAMGLFVLQFVVGFFSFLLLLCCESATASFRANLVPLHAAFGGTTFVLAVAAACTGLTEKAFFSLSFAYSKWVPYLSDEFSDVGQNTLTGLVYTPEKFEESLAINALGAGLVALAIVIPVILAYPRFRYSPQRVITVTHDRYS